jgi:trehalose/maltose hydrolase-like predicted phosphorylase
MYPTVLYFYPELAREILNYRLHALPAARDRAAETGYEGSRFPWESAFTGREATPDCCPETRDNEIHNTGDVAFAIRQYVSLTRDENWLKGPTDYVTNGCGMIREIAEFWASRSVYNTQTDQFDINGVMPPDEDHAYVNNSIFTNVVAGYSIFFAEYAKCLCGDSVPALPEEWSKRARSLAFLYDSEKDYHPEFVGYEPGTFIKQADVVLLGFPLLYPMNASTRKNDLLIYEPVTRENGPAMTWAMHTVGFLELNDEDKSNALFNKSYQPYMREPFKVWTEARAPDFGAVNFITGMGGLLQEVVSGYGGLRLHTESLEFLQPRVLPGSDALNLRGLKYLGNTFDLEVNRNSTDIRFILRSAKQEYPLEISYIQDGREISTPFGSVGQVVQVSSSGTVTIKTSTPTGCTLPFDQIGGTYSK